MLESEAIHNMNWLSGINALFGIWMIISPWVLGFSNHGSATASAIISGIVVLVLGAIRFFAGFSADRRPVVSS